MDDLALIVRCWPRLISNGDEHLGDNFARRGARLDEADAVRWASQLLAEEFGLSVSTHVNTGSLSVRFAMPRRARPDMSSSSVTWRKLEPRAGAQVKDPLVRLGERLARIPWAGYPGGILAVAVATGASSGWWRCAGILPTSPCCIWSRCWRSAIWCGSGPRSWPRLLRSSRSTGFSSSRDTLTVADPEEWVALLLFLATAVVIGQLAAGQRRRPRRPSSESATLWCSTTWLG